MAVRICLLVSDDPDDHMEFSEALDEIDGDLVVLLISDGRKVPDLVLSKRLIPDYLFIDAGLNGYRWNEFFSKLEDDADFGKMFVLAYGDESDYPKIRSKRVSAFLERDSGYSDIRKFLGKVIKGAGK